MYCTRTKSGSAVAIRSVTSMRCIRRWTLQGATAPTADKGRYVAQFME